MSKRSVKAAMRARRSSKPKFIGGRESAIEGAEAVWRGARIALVERESSNIVDIVVEGDDERYSIEGCKLCVIEPKVR